MTTTNDPTEEHELNTNGADNEKILKWESFIEEDARAALVELIRIAPLALLENIGRSIFSNIPEKAIPANFIGLPNELYLIYFLVLDPHYFQVERFATRNVTINDVKYNKGVKIPLNANVDDDCLMLAKVGLTHIDLAMIIDKKTEDVQVSIKYGNNDPHKIPFDNSKPRDVIMYNIAETATKKLFLRPDSIMTDMARYLCNGGKNSSDKPHELRYFIVETTDHHCYKSRAFEVEKRLRTNLSFPRARITKEFINEKLCESAPRSLAATIGPSEWIVTSRSIVKCLETSSVQHILYNTSSEIPLNASLRALRTTFQSDYHDKGRFHLNLQYKAWLYPPKTKRIMKKTEYSMSNLRVAEITFDQS